MAAPEDDTQTEIPPAAPAQVDPQYAKIVTGLLAQQQVPQAQPVQTDKTAPSSWTARLGEWLAGGAPTDVDLSQSQREAAGTRALRNFSIGLLGTGPFDTFGQGLARGLQAAQESQYGAEATQVERQLAEQNWQQQQFQNKLQGVKAALPLLQLQAGQSISGNVTRALTGGTAPIPGTTPGTSIGAALTPFVGKNLPQGVTPAEDQMVRTVYGEARGEPLAGQLGVANVIKNRMDASGQNAQDVIFARNQFEPWNNPKTRAMLEDLDPTSPQYQQILTKVVRPVMSGDAKDPTGGATHFYSPAAQAQLAEQDQRPLVPDWASGVKPSAAIGGHLFYNLPYGGQPAQATPYQVAGKPVAPPTGPLQPASAPAPSGAPAPPAAATGPATADLMGPRPLQPTGPGSPEPQTPEQRANTPFPVPAAPAATTTGPEVPAPQPTTMATQPPGRTSPYTGEATIPDAGAPGASYPTFVPRPVTLDTTLPAEAVQHFKQTEAQLLAARAASLPGSKEQQQFDKQLGDLRQQHEQLIASHSQEMTKTDLAQQLEGYKTGAAAWNAANQAAIDNKLKIQQIGATSDAQASTKALEEVNESGRGAAQTLQQIEMARQLSVAAGTPNFIETHPDLMNNLIRAGLITPDEIKQFGAQQALNGVINKMVLAARQGSGMSRMTNMDLQFLQNTAPGAFTPEQVRGPMLAALQTTYQRQVEYAHIVNSLHGSGMPVWQAEQKADEQLGSILKQPPAMNDPNGKDYIADPAARLEAQGKWVAQNVPNGSFYLKPNGSLTIRGAAQQTRPPQGQ